MSGFFQRYSLNEIRHQVSFYDPRLLMRRKLMKNLSPMLA